MKRKELILAVCASILLAGSAVAGISAQSPEEKAAAIADEIITMRSTLAREFIKPGVEVNEETFKKVCGAVGKRVKEISEKEGVKIRHAAVKNRNAQNMADSREVVFIHRFEQEKSLQEIKEKIEADGKSSIRYTRPIFVERACLACHGEKDARPEFIKAKYPDDRAFGFKEGDVRGILSVVVPSK